MTPVVTAFAVFSMLSLETFGTAAKLSGERCTFNKESYSPGETWIPDIRPYGCTTCTCSRRGGLVRCESKQCPRLDCLATAKQVLPGHCCPTCTDNLPPDVGPPTPPPIKANCFHSGLQRSHGERFIPTSSGVVPSAENQCTECTCWDGDVLCLLKTCPQVHCPRPVTDPGTCCATCPGATESPTAKPLSPDEDCRYSGKRYKHGQRWHPEIGKTKCIICRCNNSTIECDKLSCSGSETSACDRHCCKVCPGKDPETERRSCYYFYKQSSRRHFTLSFENSRTGKSVVHTWTIDLGLIKRNETKTIEGIQWRRSDALGAVRSNKYIRFKKRMRRQLEKCKSSCSRRSLQRLVRWLRKYSTPSNC